MLAGIPGWLESSSSMEMKAGAAGSRFYPDLWDLSIQSHVLPGVHEKTRCERVRYRIIVSDVTRDYRLSSWRMRASSAADNPPCALRRARLF